MKIEIEDSAKKNIRDIANISPILAAKISGIISSMRNFEDLNDSLLRCGSIIDLPEDISVSIKRWHALQRCKEDIWRLKVLNTLADDVERYRIIYAFYQAGQVRRDPVIRILAVLDKSEFDYDRINSKNVISIRTLYSGD